MQIGKKIFFSINNFTLEAIYAPSASNTDRVTTKVKKMLNLHFFNFQFTKARLPLFYFMHIFWK